MKVHNPHRSEMYVTRDGTFGVADSLEIFDATEWTDEELDELEYCTDNERIEIARKIAARYES